LEKHESQALPFDETNDETSSLSLATFFSLRGRETEHLMEILKIEVLFWNFKIRSVSLANLDWRSDW